MTKRGFFVLLIKVFGLNALVAGIFSTIPNNLMVGFSSVDISVILWTIAVVGIFVGICWILVLKADWLAALLKLDKGFSDERIELGNLSSADIMKLGVFVIGGLLLIRSIPDLLSRVFWAFKGELVGTEFNERDKFNFAVSVLNVLGGYLLMTNYDLVSKFFKDKSAEK
jgi:hypothetical protein